MKKVLKCIPGVPTGSSEETRGAPTFWGFYPPFDYKLQLLPIYSHPT
jgi:hypothetical protein